MIALWQCKNSNYVDDHYAYTFFKQISEDKQEFINSYSELSVITYFGEDDINQANLIYIPKEE